MLQAGGSPYDDAYGREDQHSDERPPEKSVLAARPYAGGVGVQVRGVGSFEAWSTHVLASVPARKAGGYMALSAERATLADDNRDARKENYAFLN